MNYNGPSTPLKYYPQQLAVARYYCADLNNPVCRGNFGDSTGQMELKHEYVAHVNLPDSSKALAHRLQSAVKGAMHHFDYYDEERNLLAYGQRRPPIYNISQIQTKSMFIWRGKSDPIVSDEDIMTILKGLRGE